MQETRRDLDLGDGLILVVHSLDEYSPFSVRLARRGERTAFLTPRFEVGEDLAFRFRTAKAEVRAAFDDPRQEGPLSLCSDAQGLQVEWDGKSYAVERIVWLRAISNRNDNDGVPVPSEWRTPEREPPDESRDLYVAEGIVLRIERREERILASLHGSRKLDGPALLKPSLDLRRPSTYTWLNENGIAVRLVGSDRLRVFLRGTTAGHVSLKELQRTIVGMGGQLSRPDPLKPR